MSRFSFRLADQSDDAQLRQRMASDVMHGNISLTFRREPNYFAANPIFGFSSDVIVCEESSTRRIVGHGVRHKRLAYVNGAVRSVGYLSDLRLDRDDRNGVLLARAYRYLSEFQQRDPSDYSMTMIFLGNEAAENSLVGGRAKLPEYSRVSYIDNSAIMLNRRRAEISVSGLKFAVADSVVFPKLLAFYNNVNKCRQFAPVYELSDYTGDSFLGLEIEDITYATRDGEIVAMAAVWDQGDFRQTYVEGYNRLFSLARPIYNQLAKLSPLKPLPDKGDRVPFAYIALLAVKDNDIDVHRALMREIYNRNFQKPWHYLIPSFSERDPARNLLDDYLTMEAGGTLYQVKFADDEMPALRTDFLPYIEIARI